MQSEVGGRYADLSTPGWNQVLWHVVRSVTTVVKGTGFRPRVLSRRKHKQCCQYGGAFCMREGTPYPSRLRIAQSRLLGFAHPNAFEHRGPWTEGHERSGSQADLAPREGKGSVPARLACWRSTRSGTSCMSGCTLTTRSGL